MIRLSLDRAPLVRPLTGPFEGVTLTLRRLSAPELESARAAAMDTIRSPEQLIELLERHDIWPADSAGRRRKSTDFMADPMFMTGIGEYLGAVECAVRAITEWTGVGDEQGRPVPVSRAALEVAFLSGPFMDQAMPAMTAASQILDAEKKGSGVSPSGSSEPATTASTPDTAKTAASAPRPAPRASGSAKAGPARKSKTPRSRPKAPPSGAN